MAADGGQPDLQVDVLGEFAVRHAGHGVVLPPAEQRLVAFLAIQSGGPARGPVRRRHVAGTLWCDRRDDQAAANLRAALCRLRRLPAPLVVADTTTVRLASQVRVDLWQERDDVPALSTDLLPGWTDEWLHAERERHRQARLHALERLCVQHREQGSFARALEAGLAAVQGEPLRESAHRRVIEVHLAEGNHAEALRQYEMYRTALRRELGLSPSPAIRSLVARYLGRPADGAPSGESAPTATRR